MPGGKRILEWLAINPDGPRHDGAGIAPKGLPRLGIREAVVVRPELGDAWRKLCQRRVAAGLLDVRDATAALSHASSHPCPALRARIIAAIPDSLLEACLMKCMVSPKAEVIPADGKGFLAKVKLCGAPGACVSAVAGNGDEAIAAARRLRIAWMAQVDPAAIPATDAMISEGPRRE